MLGVESRARLEGLGACGRVQHVGRGGVPGLHGRLRGGGEAGGGAELRALCGRRRSFASGPAHESSGGAGREADLELLKEKGIDLGC